MSDNPVPESPPPPTPHAAQAPGPIINGTTPDDRTMALLAHLLPIVCGIIGPLVIWLVKKDRSEFVNDQGKEAVNFHLTMLLCFFGLGVMLIIPFINCLIFPVLMALGLANLVLCIVAACKANEGVAYRYPINFRLIR